MGALAIACGALIVAFGVLTKRHAPTDAQFGVEITCLVGGLVLIFLGVILRRMDRLMRRSGEGEQVREVEAGSHRSPTEQVAAPTRFGWVRWVLRVPTRP